MARFSDRFNIPENVPRKPAINLKLQQNPLQVNGKFGLYSMTSYLGGGTYGDVLAATNQNTGQRFALKIFPKNEFTTVETEAYARLSSCSDYLACIYEIIPVIEGKQEWTILVQQIFDGDLIEYKPKANELGDMLLDLLFGLVCMHSRGIAHMDIKGDNMFTGSDASGRFYKIGDPGLACAENNERVFFQALNKCTLFGTYIPPDLLAKVGPAGNISLEEAKATDVWVLGVFFLSKLADLGLVSQDAVAPFKAALYKNAKPDVNGVVQYPRIQLLEREANLSRYFNSDGLDTDTFGRIPAPVFMETIQNMLGYNSDIRHTAQELLVYIIRDMKLAPPGKEMQYLETIIKHKSCVQQLQEQIPTLKVRTKPAAKPSITSVRKSTAKPKAKSAAKPRAKSAAKT
jgi:serine/threonine protein kinase